MENAEYKALITSEIIYKIFIVTSMVQFQESKK